MIIISWTSGETIVASRLEDKNDRNAANGYLQLDASGLIATIQNAAVNTIHIAATAPHTNHAWCNYLTGLTPTISGWTISPSPLSEVVNEDEVNFATPGTWAYNSNAYLTIDIGAIVVASITYYIIITKTSGDYTTKIMIDLEISQNGTDWSNIINVTGAAGTQYNITRAFKFRYIRIHAYGIGTNETGSLNNLSLIVR